MLCLGRSEVVDRVAMRRGCVDERKSGRERSEKVRDTVVVVLVCVYGGGGPPAKVRCAAAEKT